MDKEGWVSVSQLLGNLHKEGKYMVTLDDLKEVVSTDSKGRYSFKDNFKYIRANQGHSTPLVDLTFKEFTPNGVLYHGTPLKSLDSIRKEGLKPMQRQYVHLSKDYDTAKMVGNRRGDSVVLIISADEMYKDGVKFYESENGVVLVEYVNHAYIK